jgi:hypothetical protein
MELADLLKLDRLKYACGEVIWCNLGRLKGTDKWANLEVATKADILEGMADYHKKKYDNNAAI